MNRHLSRIIVMQSLYESDFRPLENVETIAKRNIAQFDAETDQEYIFSTIQQVNQHKSSVDPLIQEAAPEWPVDQIAVIDKTILRLASTELLFARQVPPKVIINEAVELAKAFGSDNSSKFINGVLGTLYRNSDLPKEPDVDQLLSAHEAALVSDPELPATAHVMDEGMIQAPLSGVVPPDDIEDDLEHMKQSYAGHATSKNP